jgi:hypothetical protein
MKRDHERRGNRLSGLFFSGNAMVRLGRGHLFPWIFPLLFLLTFHVSAFTMKAESTKKVEMAEPVQGSAGSYYFDGRGSHDGVEERPVWTWPEKYTGLRRKNTSTGQSVCVPLYLCLYWENHYFNNSH